LLGKSPPTFQQGCPEAIESFGGESVLKIRELWELRDEDARQLLGGSPMVRFTNEEKKRVALLTKTG